MRVAIITDQAIGGNFLAWSLLWLSGQNSYLDLVNQNIRELTASPLTDKNSHRFRSNHALTLEQVVNMLDSAPQDNQLHHVYFHLLGHNGPYSADKSKQDTGLAIEFAAARCDKVITINLSNNYDLYHCALKRRVLGQNLLGTGKHESDQAALEDYIKYYFNDCLAQWQSLGLTNVWDQREFLALNMRPFSYPRLTDCHKFDFDCYDLPAHVCWLGLDRHIQDVLDYCELRLDPSRLQTWLDIYRHWQTQHQDRVKFCWFFDTIIDGILHNRNLNLETFNLDICREAAIQHVLLYNHNLNLKTWQLEKFTNTQQLHLLLENNFHTLGING